MKTNWFKYLLISFIAMGTVWVSCDEDEINNLLNNSDKKQFLAKDAANSAAIEQDIFILVSSNGFRDDVDDVKKNHLDECPAITYVSNGGIDPFPALMTFDFGDGCEYKGKERKGIVTALFTNDWSTGFDGMTSTINFDNYYVDGVKQEGTMTITYNSDDNLQPSFQYNCLDCKLIYPADTTFQDSVFTWNGTKTFSWQNGFEGFGENIDYDFNDDIIYISGQTSGVNRDGNNFSIIINNDDPLWYDATCDWMKSGTINMTEGTSVTTIDFAPSPDNQTQECDNFVTITVDGITLETNID